MKREKFDYFNYWWSSLPTLNENDSKIFYFASWADLQSTPQPTFPSQTPNLYSNLLLNRKAVTIPFFFVWQHKPSFKMLLKIKYMKVGVLWKANSEIRDYASLWAQTTTENVTKPRYLVIIWMWINSHQNQSHGHE